MFNIDSIQLSDKRRHDIVVLYAYSKLPGASLPVHAAKCENLVILTDRDNQLVFSIQMLTLCSCPIFCSC